MTVSDCFSDVHRGVGEDGEHLIDGSDWVGGMMCEVQSMKRVTRIEERKKKGKSTTKNRGTCVDCNNADGDKDGDEMS